MQITDHFLRYVYFSKAFFVKGFAYVLGMT